MNFRIGGMLAGKTPFFHREADQLFMDMLKNVGTTQSYLHKQLALLQSIAENQTILRFLISCSHNTYTLEHTDYAMMVSLLKQIYDQHDEMYLTFIGILANEDALDNFGRTRQHECRQGLRAKYVMSERPWFLETMANGGNETITLPYRDTSGSYILSITKAIKSNGEVLGVFGFDMNLRAVIKNIKTNSRFLIVASKGEILYDSAQKVRNLFEKKYNLMMLVKPPLYKSIINNESRAAVDYFEERQTVLSFAPIINNKYYLLQLPTKNKN